MIPEYTQGFGSCLLGKQLKNDVVVLQREGRERGAGESAADEPAG